MLLIDNYKPVDVYGNYSTGKSDDYSKTRMLINGPCDVVFAGSLYVVPSGLVGGRRSVLEPYQNAFLIRRRGVIGTVSCRDVYIIILETANTPHFVTYQLATLATCCHFGFWHSPWVL